LEFLAALRGCAVHPTKTGLHFQEKYCDLNPYNFCRVHPTLRVTSAMEAGLSNYVWTVAELLVES
jgi:hypothetical protein